MGQTVYADLLFLINFSMDFLCFYLCAKLLCRKLMAGRTALASAAGGVYAVISLLLQVGTVAAILLDVAVCVLMCAASFGGKGRWRSVLPTVPVYFAVSMVLGGFMTVLFSWFNRIIEPMAEQESGEVDVSIWLFALMAALSALFALAGGRFFRKRTAQKRAEVRVTYEGRSVRLCAMTDSGNLLREPISGKPCIVADVDAMASILPSALSHAVKQGTLSRLSQLSPQQSRHIRLVPTNTVAGGGMLPALCAERIEIETEKGCHVADAWIVLSVLDGGADGTQALLPTELLV